MVKSGSASNKLSEGFADLGPLARREDFFGFMLQRPLHGLDKTSPVCWAMVLAAETEFLRVEAKTKACPPVFNVFKTRFTVGYMGFLLDFSCVAVFVLDFIV